ncbi:MAG TPA: cytochrome ubiquinol oxidase subunit I [Burkholderiales bacterium]|jgi:cytochrome d ubiquinol oxidase subunit I|nr:cytochrome ubiquinol oxidase subunit I [Burkholderiales bacterium]
MFDDPLLLARAQFGLNISFHILFPSITIALAWVLLYLRIRIGRRGPGWLAQAYRLWVKIFALSFALGVVSGITMSFQFGTNWPGFMQKAGNIAGPLLGYEVLTAFFLEATFLGVMLFGRERVPGWLHTLSAFLVAAGTTASAFWILALNSWMQTPRGFEAIEGQLHATDWWAIIFNPSFPYRLAHMMIASGLTAAFLIAGISALQLLRNRAFEPARRMLRTGVAVAAVLAPVQILVGDLHGLNTLEHQPAKIAAIEGIWETGRGVPLLLFALPNERERRNDYAIAIPKGASWILTHDADGELKGLNEFPGAHPPVAAVFWSFRLMVGVGVLMLAFAWFGSVVLLRKREPPRWLLRGFAAMTFSGWVATLAGWYTTEIGRQPYLVYGVITTAETASSVPAGDIALTLIGYAIVYALLLVSYMVVLTQLAIKDATGEAYRAAAQPAEPRVA